MHVAHHREHIISSTPSSTLPPPGGTLSRPSTSPSSVLGACNGRSDTVHAVRKGPMGSRLACMSQMCGPQRS